MVTAIETVQVVNILRPLKMLSSRNTSHHKQTSCEQRTMSLFPSRNTGVGHTAVQGDLTTTRLPSSLHAQHANLGAHACWACSRLIWGLHHGAETRSRLPRTNCISLRDVLTDDALTVANYSVDPQRLLSHPLSKANPTTSVLLTLRWQCWRTFHQATLCSSVKVKVKFTQHRSRRPREGVEVWLCSFFNLDARCGWVVNATPRPLYAR